MLSSLDELYSYFPPFCSMGGSVAVHVAARKVMPNITGLVVVDVVEVCFTLVIWNTKFTLPMLWLGSKTFHLDNLLYILQFHPWLLFIYFQNRGRPWHHWFICKKFYQVECNISPPSRRQYVYYLICSIIFNCVMYLLFFGE